MLNRASASTQAAHGASADFASHSCDYCRLRRVKCDRNKPSCGRCVAEGVACQYAAARRNRRQELEQQLLEAVNENRRLQKILDARSESFSSGDDSEGLLVTSSDANDTDEELSRILDQRHARLAHIYEAIRECDAESLSLVIDAVQKSVSLDEVTQCIYQEVVSLSPLAKLLHNNPSKASVPKRHLKPIHYRPLYSVTASPWTDVVSDDFIVSHLISLYFTWDQPLFNIIEKRCFLADMTSGRQRFCCPILVTAILATACPLHFSLDAPWDKKDADKLQIRLLDKARNMWQTQQHQPTITRIQAAMLLTCVEAARGRDKLGMEYFRQGLQMAMNLGLDKVSLDHIVDGEDPFDAEDTRQCLAYCAWGIFNCQGYIAQLMHTTPIWTYPPKVEFPYPLDLKADIEDWTPYPFSQPIQQTKTYTILRCSQGFYTIVNRLISMLSENERMETDTRKSTLNAMYSELKSWEATLPSSLDMKTNTTPHNILFRLTYYLVVLNLCRNVLEQDEDEQPNEIDYDAVRFDARRQARDLVCLYFSCHGWKSASTILYQTLYTVFTENLQYIVEKEQKWRDCINLCVSGLWHLSFSYPFCRALLRLVLLAIREQHIAAEHLSPTTWKILDTFDKKVWKAEDIALMQSAYPVSAEPTEPDDGKAELQTVLRAWEQLKLS